MFAVVSERKYGEKCFVGKKSFGNFSKKLPLFKMNKLQLWYPVKKPMFVSQGFGDTRFLQFYKDNGLNLKGHNGVDFVTKYAEQVRVAHDGEVVFAGVDSKEGWGIVVRTDNPFEYNGREVYFKTIYWHLIKDFPVKVGQKVKIGDVIGYSDSTGLSTANHLHFGLKPQLKGEDEWTFTNVENGNGYYGAIDPNSYWNGYYAQDVNIVLSILTTIRDLWAKVVSLLLKK